MHGNDGTVFEPEACHPVRQHVQPALGSFGRDRFRERGIAGQVVAQILDHVRRFVTGEGAAVMRIGVDVVAEIGQPVGVEHHEGRHLALDCAAAKLAQGFNRALARGLQRAALGLRQHQRGHVADLGGKDQLSHLLDFQFRKRI
ncbi:hypothetical protein ES703_46356 [subsurface metagenome]